MPPKSAASYNYDRWHTTADVLNNPLMMRILGDAKPSSMFHVIDVIDERSRAADTKDAVALSLYNATEQELKDFGSVCCGFINPSILAPFGKTMKGVASGPKTAAIKSFIDKLPTDGVEEFNYIEFWLSMMQSLSCSEQFNVGLASCGAFLPTLEQLSEVVVDVWHIDRLMSILRNICSTWPPRKHVMGLDSCKGKVSPAMKFTQSVLLKLFELPAGIFYGEISPTVGVLFTAMRNLCTQPGTVTQYEVDERYWISVAPQSFVVFLKDVAYEGVKKRLEGGEKYQAAFAQLMLLFQTIYMNCFSAPNQSQHFNFLMSKDMAQFCIKVVQFAEKNVDKMDSLSIEGVLGTVRNYSSTPPGYVTLVDVAGVDAVALFLKAVIVLEETTSLQKYVPLLSVKSAGHAVTILRNCTLTRDRAALRNESETPKLLYFIVLHLIDRRNCSAAMGDPDILYFFPTEYDVGNLFACLRNSLFHACIIKEFVANSGCLKFWEKLKGDFLPLMIKSDEACVHFTATVCNSLISPNKELFSGAQFSTLVVIIRDMVVELGMVTKDFQVAANCFMSVRNGLAQPFTNTNGRVPAEHYPWNSASVRDMMCRLTKDLLTPENFDRIKANITMNTPAHAKDLPKSQSEAVWFLDALTQCSFAVRNVASNTNTTFEHFATSEMGELLERILYFVQFMDHSPSLKETFFQLSCGLRNLSLSRSNSVNIMEGKFVECVLKAFGIRAVLREAVQPMDEGQGVRYYYAPSFTLLERDPQLYKDLGEHLLAAIYNYNFQSRDVAQKLMFCSTPLVVLVARLTQLCQASSASLNLMRTLVPDSVEANLCVQEGDTFRNYDQVPAEYIEGVDTATFQAASHLWYNSDASSVVAHACALVKSTDHVEVFSQKVVQDWVQSTTTKRPRMEMNTTAVTPL